MSIREATLNDVEAISPLFDAYRVFYEKRVIWTVRHSA